MKPQERYEWIEKWMRRGTGKTVDVLYSDFVDDYAEATGEKVVYMPFCANKCRQLGRDLSAMEKSGILSRSVTGLPSGDAAMGFPKWVFVYRINEHWRPQ